MSETTQHPDYTQDDRTPAEKLAEHQETFEMVAETDLPYAKWAERALEVIEEGDV